jgi:uncharacterized protein DUF397
MESTDLKWRKTSYSSNGGGNCVEVADHGSRVLVRDTKDHTGPMLRFTAAAWRRFADQVKRLLASDPLPGAGRRSARRGRSRVLGALPSLCRDCLPIDADAGNPVPTATEQVGRAQK